uniref:Ribonuclease H-like domain-containing protein n=1 Tax=Tanacetum cinerariifolium TaxID=118510 RepID=A0A6L2N8W5_TANCI|nr:ribonuclease H-like domain-containing protein [Tanacetum cinerariifolium]
MMHLWLMEFLMVHLVEIEMKILLWDKGLIMRLEWKSWGEERMKRIMVKMMKNIVDADEEEVEERPLLVHNPFESFTLVERFSHHGLDLLSLIQFFYDYVDNYTQMDLDFAADGNLRELSGEEAWEALENFAQGQKEWDNPPNIIYEQEVANLKAQAKRLFRNEKVWVEMHRGISWDKVENLNPQSTLQVIPSFEEYTPPVTYLEEGKKTLGTPIEVEPLDETQLEDLRLNTYNHDIPLSFKEVPSFDEPEPQLQHLPNCTPLNVSLGNERGLKPPIKQYN